MTKRLYNEDGYMKSFRANVVSCTPYKEKMYQVVLDRTAFFPEGGGQSGDTGTIQDVNVLDVKDKNDLVVHITDGPLEEGWEVEGNLNWEERFDKMQQHTAEHIASGIINKVFGYQNVGFHLNREIVTMDYDGVITRSQAQELEMKVNQAVFANVPIAVTYPSKEKLENLLYRSKIEIEGQVRIVEILGYDICACCAPHVKTTGEIGCVKFTDVQSHRGGVRITMKCGKRAILDYQEKMMNVRAIGSMLSAKEAEVQNAVQRLQSELQMVKSQNWELQNILIEHKVKEVLESGSESVIIFVSELDGDHRRELVNRLVANDVRIVCVLSGNDENGYQYILGSKDIDVRAVGRELNSSCNGRGGGKPGMVQGSLMVTKNRIEEAWLKHLMELH